MIQAIIDIGSNTVRMALYEISDNKIEFLMKKKHLVGLAAYLENNIMSDKGIEKLCEVLREFQGFLEIFKIDNLVTFATAAVRNCDNSPEVVAKIYRRTGIKVQIISGDQEADYDFIGATRNVQDTKGILADIGGGSTELVYYENGQHLHKISLPMGSLAFKTKYCSEVLPNKYELDLMLQEARRMVATAQDFDQIKGDTLCGIGGTFKGLRGIYNAQYNQGEENFEIPASCIGEIINHFSNSDALNQQDAILLMINVPDRIHTIFPGLAIAQVLVEKFQCKKIIYSDSGVREGYIYSEIIKDEKNNQ